MDVNCHYQELIQTEGYVLAEKVKNAYLGIGVKQEMLLYVADTDSSEVGRVV
ncbi:hypothetical protein [Coprobacter tertius]|uniref:hypothetical protein n=1 Tax=Coprobacter tertius TaxID=2944915 RepID=UPI003F491BFA